MKLGRMGPNRTIEVILAMSGAFERQPNGSYDGDVIFHIENVEEGLCLVGTVKDALSKFDVK